MNSKHGVSIIILFWKERVTSSNIDDIWYEMYIRKMHFTGF